MANSDAHFQAGSMQNPDVPFPDALLGFLDERAAAVRDVSYEDYAVLATDDEVQERAQIVRRLYDKLGILAEMEELWRLDAKRRARLSGREER
jgi:hypothetical protein